MSTLLFLAGLVVIGLVAIATAAPLLRNSDVTGRGARALGDVGDAQRERHRLEKEKELAYGAIKEAEFDFQMGKLSAEDYAALRDKYETRALGALEALEQLS